MHVTREETSRHLTYLDGWRGVAIFLVLLGHFFLDEAIPGVSTLGVALFFVLSGRLMADILFVRNTPLPFFFARRFSRVYPALAFFVVVVTAVFAETEYRNGVAAAVAGLTFTLNYAMLYDHGVALLDHLWSLCVEEHGYAILALVALGVRARNWSAPVIIMVAGAASLFNGIVQTIAFDKDYFSVFWRTDVAVAPLFLSAAVYLLRRPTPGQPANQWAAPLALALGAGLAIWGGHVILTFGVSTVLLALSINWVDAAPIFQRLLANRALRQLGVWSYSIYLWQHPFFKISRQHHSLSVPLLFAGVAAGLISFYVIEQPMRRYLNARQTSMEPKARGARPVAASPR